MPGSEPSGVLSPLINACESISLRGREGKASARMACRREKTRRRLGEEKGFCFFPPRSETSFICYCRLSPTSTSSKLGIVPSSSFVKNRCLLVRSLVFIRLTRSAPE